MLLQLLGSIRGLIRLMQMVEKRSFILCGVLNDRMNSIGGQRSECNAAESVLDTLDLTRVHCIVMGGA